MTCPTSRPNGAIPVMASRPKRGVILYRSYYVAFDKWNEVKV